MTLVPLTLALAWIRAHVKPLLFISAALLVLAIAFCRPTPNPIPPREQHSIDSLAITRSVFDSGQRARAKAETVYVAQSSRKAAVAEATHAATDSLREAAIVLQARAEAARDTSSAWRSAALAWHQTADSAIARGDTLASALQDERSARTLADQQVTAERARRMAVEDLNSRLARDVRTAGQCRILWVASCPSRKAVLVGGVLVGVVGKYVADRQR